MEGEMFQEAGTSTQAPVAVTKRDRQGPQGLKGFEKSGKEKHEMTEMIASCFFWWVCREHFAWKVEEWRPSKESSEGDFGFDQIDVEIQDRIDDMVTWSQ